MVIIAVEYRRAISRQGTDHFSLHMSHPLDGTEPFEVGGGRVRIKAEPLYAQDKFDVVMM